MVTPRWTPTATFVPVSIHAEPGWPIFWNCRAFGFIDLAPEDGGAR